MFPLYDDNPTRQTPLATYALLLVNVLVFLWLIRLPDLQQQEIVYRHGFMPKRIEQLSNHQLLAVPIKVLVHIPFWGDQIVPRPIMLAADPRQIWASLLTYMFLHGGWMHLLGNMWFLWLFGSRVEGRVGSSLYLILYLLGGVIAGVSHWVVDPDSVLPVIGASGAVAAVLGAYAVAWPWARVRTLLFLLLFVTIVDVPAMFFLGAWFILQVVAGHHALYHAGSGGVAWWAHVGGFLAGIILMPVFSLLAVGTKSDNRVIEE